MSFFCCNIKNSQSQLQSNSLRILRVVSTELQTTEQRSEFLWLKYSVIIIPALHCTPLSSSNISHFSHHLPGWVRTRTVARPDRGRAIIFLISWESLNSNTTRLSIIEIHDCLPPHSSCIYHCQHSKYFIKTCHLVSGHCIALY